MEKLIGSKAWITYPSRPSSILGPTPPYGQRLSDIPIGWEIIIPGNVLITDDLNTDKAGFDHVLHFKPPFGPYPPELSETYPLNAEVPVEADHAAMEKAMESTKRLMEANPQAKFSLQLEKECRKTQAE